MKGGVWIHGITPPPQRDRVPLFSPCPKRRGENTVQKKYTLFFNECLRKRQKIVVQCRNLSPPSWAQKKCATHSLPPTVRGGPSIKGVRVRVMGMNEVTSTVGVDAAFVLALCHFWGKSRWLPTDKKMAGHGKKSIGVNFYNYHPQWRAAFSSRRNSKKIISANVLAQKLQKFMTELCCQYTDLKHKQVM